MAQITLPVLNRYVSFLNKLHDTGLQFDIDVGQTYRNSSYEAEFTPKIKDVKHVGQLATCFTAKNAPIKASHLDGMPDALLRLFEKENCVLVQKADSTKEASVKFFAKEAFDSEEAFDAYLITAAPVELRLGDHTYRVLTCGSSYYYSELVLCVNEEHPAYNYIDKGHIVVFGQSTNSADGNFFVTNQMTLDMNYVAACFHVYPKMLPELVQANTSFIDSRNARVLLLKAERAVPPRLKEAYGKLKVAILADFEKNAQNMMVGKLQRGETPFVELNNIKIERTKATYETITIEADNLAEVVFQKLNPNEAEWDVYTLINIYTDYVEKYFDGRELNATATGFLEAANRVFKINGINIRVENFTTHVRRAVNGKLINKDELSKVMRRASCFDNQADFDAFVTGVSKVSLRLTDIVANGLPVKTVYLEEDRQHNKDAGNKHPKLKFIRKDSKFLLMIDKDTTRPVKRMVEFVNKIMACNRRHRMPYYGYRQTHEGGYETGQGPNDVEKELLTIFPEYIEGITAAEITALVKFVNKERIEAEKRSERFLAAAVQQTGAERMQYKEKWGYKIKGIMRNYFVEEDALRVYNYDTGQYICVVSKGFQGVGKDALVTRLFALSNDQYVAKDVGTLK